MSIVAERRRQQQTGQAYAGTKTLQQLTTGHGQVTDATFVRTPIHGELQGQSVRILAFGNVEGFSPGALITDDDGDMQWVPLEEVRVLDPNYRPMTK